MDTDTEPRQFTPLDLSDPSTWAASESCSVFKAGWDAALAEVTAQGYTLPTTNLEQLENIAIDQALEIHEGNRTHAARELGCSIRTLQRKLLRRQSAISQSLSH